MLSKIISGGQTGADQAALRAARTAGIATGGWAPLGWQTEVGPAPWLADYDLRECPTPGYPARTAANVRDSDATVWFGSVDSRGWACTAKAATKLFRPWFDVGSETTPRELVDWLVANDVKVLNVAGNRRSINPEIGGHVERFLMVVFTILGSLAKNLAVPT